MESVFFTILLGIIVAGLVVIVLFLIKKRGPEGKLAALEAIMKQMSEESFRQFSQLRQDVTANLKVGHEDFARSSEASHRLLQDFTKNITEMKGALERVNESVKDTTGKVTAFQDIFKTPQRYGPWSESSLQHLLAQRYP